MSTRADRVRGSGPARLQEGPSRRVCRLRLQPKDLVSGKQQSIWKVPLFGHVLTHQTVFDNRLIFCAISASGLSRPTRPAPGSPK